LLVAFDIIVPFEMKRGTTTHIALLIDSIEFNSFNFDIDERNCSKIANFIPLLATTLFCSDSKTFFSLTDCVPQ
jgi:hypothetical protein